MKVLSGIFLLLITSLSGYAQEPVKLLIVYPDSLAPAIYDYQKFREAAGVETVLLPLSAAGKFPNEYELKESLEKTRESYKFSHLLLAGSLYHIPMHESAGNTYTDHFYALMDKDSLPDFAIGRLPVHGQADVRHYLQKARKAEGSPYKQRGSIVVRGASAPDARIAQQAGEWLTEQGYDVKPYPAGSSPDLATLLTDTALAVVFQIGLGTAPGWMDISRPFTTYEAGQLESAPLHTVISVACSTAGPQYREALATALILNPLGGALTYIGCSGNCLVKWADELGLAILQATGAAQTIGEAFLEGQLNYRQSFHPQDPLETTHSLEQFTLIGDPSLRIALPNK